VLAIEGRVVVRPRIQRLLPNCASVRQTA